MPADRHANDAAAENWRQRCAEGAACLQAALAYLQRGWSVLAICPPDHVGVGKTHGQQCKSPGKAPWGDWKEYQDRLPTEAELLKKWRDNPTLNVGLALGPVSGLVRLDIDGPGGEQRLAEYSGGDLPMTWEFTSGRDNGGRGLLYAIPPGVLFMTTHEKPDKKQELRFQAKGAQTVLPPSRHPDGPLYAWKPRHGPEDITVAAAPDWMVKRWGVGQNGHTTGHRKAESLDDDEVIEEGKRDDTLASLAGTMRRRGMGREEIEAALLIVNARRCQPALDESQVAKIAASIAKRKAADPALLRIGRTGELPNGDGKEPEPWAPPVPFTAPGSLPPFPVDKLPFWLAAWVEAEAIATQTPPDLAGNLAIAVVAAALACKARALIRGGWREPANIFTVTSLPPGERKSAVFRAALEPVLEHAQDEQDRMTPVIAELASVHRMMEKELENVERKAAREEDPTERLRLREDAKRLAKELEAHKVPDLPQLFTDDVTPEKLGQLLARQRGRMLLASAEGTIFEIAKGKYSETANFDVFLKGHAGDPLRTDRMSRKGEAINHPALSCALAVQPDVIAGLSEQASMRGRGFLARWLYSLPVSRCGRREIAPAPVPGGIAADYRDAMLRLWSLPVLELEPAGRDVPFSRSADESLRAFEQELEPQLADGEPLAYLAGWGSKLAGAIARLSLIFHVSEHLGGAGGDWTAPIEAETVEAAIIIGRDYYLPHARAAFGAMGADERSRDASRVVGWLAKRNFETLKLWRGVRVVSKGDIHGKVFGGTRSVEEVNLVCRLLCEHGYLRNAGPAWRRDVQVFEVTPEPLSAVEIE
jgi:hypothetical protein